MIYISGKVHPGWPAMLTPMMGNRVPAEGLWAADTGCFSRPDAYSDDWYLGWLRARIPFQDRCLFATAPDAFEDGLRTLELATPVLPLIRALGYRAALVAQPGMTVENVPWDEFDVLFVGGPNGWQHSEGLADLAREAKRRGKWLHVGRVNVLWRIRWALSIGADSADGTFLAFAPDRYDPLLRRWLEEAHAAPSIWETTSA